MLIYKEFTFDSAHFLPNVPDGHKCKGIHGHTYKLTLFIEGELDQHLGWVMDFSDLKDTVMPVVDMADHKLLNNVAGLENPTCELFAVWFWNKIKPNVPQLKRIQLDETPTSGVIYEG